MLKMFQIRFAVIALALATLGAGALAVLNFNQENNFQEPTDGVWWQESQGVLEAQRVPHDTPGYRAGIKPGDILTSINDHTTPFLPDQMQQMLSAGIYSTASYSLLRKNPVNGAQVEINTSVILVPVDRSINLGMRIIALFYLCIGIYVLFRRWTAPKSTHFYLFCLVSFVYYACHSTHELNNFDWSILWINLLAEALQPALFLHFALTFPEERRVLHRQRWIIPVIYLPGMVDLGLNIVALNQWRVTGLLLHRLDQIGLGYVALYYVIASLVFFFSYRRTTTPLLRQQLKWLTRGTLLAVIPFTCLYVIPYLSDLSVPGWMERIASISIVFIPLTFSYAIVRYRLMDVDLISKRVVTYTLATAALVGIYFLIVAVVAVTLHTRVPSLGVWGLIIVIAATAAVFDPLKHLIQVRMDRLFDRSRYDYRGTLIEFGRGLSTQTDLQALLASIVDRLPRALLVARTAVFLSDDAGNYHLAAAHGLPGYVLDSALRNSDAGQRNPGSTTPGHLDLSFFHFDQPGSGSHIFLEQPHQAMHLTSAQQTSAALLDLNYYLPCRVQARTIAVIGLGRTTRGDFLSSEDMELVESLASYIGIAIQNARLYTSLQEKIAEYERLKEFNENIVESVNIGILAVDLEDRIEGWNTQMEVMYSTPRAEALGRPLASLFSADFIAELARVKDHPGIHNLYKFRLTAPSGEVRVANIAIAPLMTRHLQAIGRLILLDDITDRIDLETQLAQAEKLSSIGLLAAGVAHEVNTPLAVISSYTQMLLKESTGDNRIGTMLEKITQQTFRASEIVNGLLNFSRTGAAEFSSVDLNHTIRETLVLLEHQFKTSGITVETDLAPALPPINGNQGKLQQVFLNLFLNARDSMTTGGKLRVTTYSNGHAGVSIQDSGSGISPEHMHRIYDPFFTTKSAPREDQRRGTGLGLAVTYGIIQEHAGKIHVESRIGEGTCFYLEFPLKSPAASTTAPDPTRKPAHV
jgi:PAS domain S-box-containing protein